MKAQEQLIIQALGSTERVESKLTEAEKLAEAEERLKHGFCDRKVLGEPRCKRWKFELDSKPVSDEQGDLETMAAFWDQSCPPTSIDEISPCSAAKKEIQKTYVLSKERDSDIKLGWKAGRNLKDLPRLGFKLNKDEVETGTYSACLDMLVSDLVSQH